MKKGRRLQDQTRSEHEELRRRLDRVHSGLAEDRSAPDALRQTFEELRQFVEGHFQSEERSGLFDDIATVAPRLSDRAQAILDQHVQLRDTMRSLHDRALLTATDESWESLKLQFEQFSQQIVEHEEAEDQLLLEAYSDDVGAQD